MQKNRLEAFSDGVIAILITIMVFEVKAPTGANSEALVSIIPIFFTYLLSFLYLGIYWNNHHHMLQLTRRINGGVLWANLHLLFWLSLFPFTTNWMRGSGFQSLPVAVYGLVLFLAGLSYSLLQGTIIRADGEGSSLRAAVGSDFKGKASLVLYLFGIAAAFLVPLLAVTFYVVVAFLWLIPDPRIEKHLAAGARE